MNKQKVPVSREKTILNMLSIEGVNNAWLREQMNISKSSFSYKKSGERGINEEDEKNIIQALLDLRSRIDDQLKDLPEFI